MPPLDPKYMYECGIVSVLLSARIKPRTVGVMITFSNVSNLEIFFVTFRAYLNHSIKMSTTFLNKDEKELTSTQLMRQVQES